jgi:hypothetical protein
MSETTLSATASVRSKGGRRPGGPYTRRGPLTKIDGRSKIAATINGIRADLTARVGGKPTPAQRAAIEAACLLSLRVSQFDIKDFGAMTADGIADYVAINDALVAALSRLDALKSE